MEKKLQVSNQEWGLIGIRLIGIIGLITYLSVNGGRIDEQTVVTGGVLIGLSLMVEVALAVLFSSEQWTIGALTGVVVLDALLGIAAVFLIDIQFAWMAIIPVVVLAFYFDWLYSLLLGASVALVMASTVTFQSFSSSSLIALIVSVFGLVGAGPVTYFLRNTDESSTTLVGDIGANGNNKNREKADRVARLATEYMRIVYEMAEVINRSHLEPRRVLSTTVEFAMDGLERVGAPSPLFGSILLFAESDVPGVAFTVLRVGYQGGTVAQKDYEVVVPGLEGAIDKAVRTDSVQITHAPHADPELSKFQTYKECKTVMVIPLRTGKDIYGVMLCGSLQAEAFDNLHRELMMAVSNQAASALHTAKLYVSLKQQRDRIVEVEKAARAQLAGELHDGPTQGIAAITMRLNYIRKLLERKPERAGDELYQVEDMARRTAKEIRAMLFELRPKALDQGLEAGLEQLAIKNRETYEQAVEYYVEDSCDQLLDDQTTQTLFSIAVEAVNNARKHAQASLITIEARVRADTFMLEIQDNGRGFDVEEALYQARNREGHLGLTNLQERATLVEGNLKIESQVGVGTTMTVLIPMSVLRERLREQRERKAAEAGEQPITEGYLPF